MIKNRYLKPKEAVCSVCGDKIKVGEKYALGTVKAYTDDILTYEEIFCGFCKPTSLEYDGVFEYEGCIRVPDIIRKGKQYYRMERACVYIEKHLDFYRNKKEVTES